MRQSSGYLGQAALAGFAVSSRDSFQKTLPEGVVFQPIASDFSTVPYHLRHQMQVRHFVEKFGDWAKKPVDVDLFKRRSRETFRIGGVFIIRTPQQSFAVVFNDFFLHQDAVVAGTFDSKGKPVHPFCGFVGVSAQMYFNSYS